MCHLSPWWMTLFPSSELQCSGQVVFSVWRAPGMASMRHKATRLSFPKQTACRDRRAYLKWSVSALCGLKPLERSGGGPRLQSCLGGGGEAVAAVAVVMERIKNVPLKCWPFALSAPLIVTPTCCLFKAVFLHSSLQQTSSYRRCLLTSCISPLLLLEQISHTCAAIGWFVLLSPNKCKASVAIGLLYSVGNLF